MVLNSTQRHLVEPPLYFACSVPTELIDSSLRHSRTSSPALRVARVWRYVPSNRTQAPSLAGRLQIRICAEAGDAPRARQAIANVTRAEIDLSIGNSQDRRMEFS